MKVPWMLKVVWVSSRRAYAGGSSAGVGCNTRGGGGAIEGLL